MLCCFMATAAFKQPCRMKARCRLSETWPVAHRSHEESQECVRKMNAVIVFALFSYFFIVVREGKVLFDINNDISLKSTAA